MVVHFAFVEEDWVQGFPKIFDDFNADKRYIWRWAEYFRRLLKTIQRLPRVTSRRLPKAIVLPLCLTKLLNSSSIKNKEYALFVFNFYQWLSCEFLQISVTRTILAVISPTLALSTQLYHPEKLRWQHWVTEKESQYRTNVISWPRWLLGFVSICATNHRNKLYYLCFTA